MKTKKDRTPSYGEVRVITKFIWYPLNLVIEGTNFRQTRWLEFATVVQENVPYSSVQSNWVDKYWTE